MPTYIRLTKYKNSEEKEKGFFDPKNRYEAKQEDFFKIPGAPIAYWVSDRVREIFEQSEKLGNLYDVKQGMATSDNNRFLRFWYEISINKLGLNIKNLEEAKKSNHKWFPYNKGGEFRKWYGNNEFVVNYENDGYELKQFQSALNQGWHVRLKSRDFYFKESINWSFVSSSIFGVRYSPDGFIFDVGGSSLFPEKENFFYINALLNSIVAFNNLNIINPTMNFQVKDLNSIPMIFPNSPKTKQKIDQLTQECIDISKEEWDSRETSWDFKTNELLRLQKEHGFQKIEDAYNAYCDYWRKKFYKLHQNEEELNRLFIEIYGLQDELTPDVPLEDITILKKEAKIVGGELVFNKAEIIRQFISYAVGVMFGRYSLDHPGLHIANMNESPKEANAKFHIDHPTFEIDDDNIIPVLEDEYFSDDIVARFKKFVEVTFGKEHLLENLRFIEEALGMDVRKYFYKEFFKDHIQRYKKRPIYWMITSPNKTFQALIYMHQYTPDIFAKVRTDYLLELIAKLEAKKEYLQNQSTTTSSQRRKIDKEIETIQKKLKELYNFDRNNLEKYANALIEIDLDDGVKVNYCKFKEILHPISGLCKGN